MKPKYLFLCNSKHQSKTEISKMKRTFAILKPDTVERNLIGKILERVEYNGFKIAAMKKVQLTKPQAEGFYYVHKARPFFGA